MASITSYQFQMSVKGKSSVVWISQYLSELMPAEYKINKQDQ